MIDSSQASTTRPIPGGGARRQWASLAHVATLGFALVGVALLVTSRPRLSATYDESNHLVAGLEWWQHGTYTAWTENPPLARVALAALPHLTGTRLPDRRRWDLRSNHCLAPWFTGVDLLHEGERYESNLARARQGTLPFFLIIMGAVWLLADGRRRPISGLIAVGATATMPPLLGHAGLATTDVVFVATFLLAVLAGGRWLTRPSPGTAAWLGLACGAAALAKFSALVFLPVVFAAALVARRLLAQEGEGSVPDAGRPRGWRGVPCQLGLAGLVAALTVWAGYRFSLGPIGALPQQAMGWFSILPERATRGPLTDWLLNLTVPAPELFHGLLFLRAHNQAGHTAYLLGEVSRSGFPGFYLVALMVKTPLPFLALVAAATLRLARRPRTTEPWRAVALFAGALGIVAVSSTSRLNLGLRHVLPVLPLLAVGAGLALGSLGRPLALAAVGAALLAQAGSAVAARPNLLAYFNPLAGKDPAAVLLDSDLDWGQGLLQLRDELRRRGAADVAIAYAGFTNPCRLGLPSLRALPPGRPQTGWIAVSENYFRDRSHLLLRRDPCDFGTVYPPGEVGPAPFAWLRAHQPLTVVAGSIRLYHIEP
jgi:4-amino-4-deoxy-L-arabinose transferase-like glycosyltransferase